MHRPLEYGEKVLILKDPDFPQDMLPCVGWVISTASSSVLYIASDMSYTPDQFVMPEEDDPSFCMSFSDSIRVQTETGRRDVVRYGEQKMNLAGFLKKVEKDYANVS